MGAVNFMEDIPTYNNAKLYAIKVIVNLLIQHSQVAFVSVSE